MGEVYQSFKKKKIPALKKLFQKKIKDKTFPLYSIRITLVSKLNMHSSWKKTVQFNLQP